MVPPGRVTSASNAVRRLMARGHRATAPPPLRVLEAVFARFDVHVLATLVDLDVPDLLDEATTVAALADRTGTDPDRLGRVVRYAAGRGFVTVDRDGRVGPTPLTRALRRDAAAPWRGWIRFGGADWFGEAFQHLTEGLAPGAPEPFRLAHGTDFFTHTTRVDPAAGEAFDEAMQAGATLQGIGLARTLDWAGVATVCDVGGGVGATLDVLVRYHPHLEVTLFDLPEVVAHAELDPATAHLVGGSFFDEVPAGCDRYLLLAIVHDWADDDAVAILANAVEALAPGGRIVVVENVASERPRDDFAAATDLMMFVLATGRERTDDEYRALFARAGLGVDERVLLPTAATAFVLAPR